jgi:hypothetical protein
VNQHYFGYPIPNFVVVSNSSIVYIPSRMILRRISRMKRRVTISTLCLGIVAAAVVLFIGIAPPRAVSAAPGCSVADARGEYGFQFFGTIQPGTPAPLTFAETGKMVVDRDGKLTGEGQYSAGGFFVTHRFTGSVDVKPDCTAIANIDDTFNSAGSLFHAQAYWVIVKPHEDILMTSLAQSGAVNGRMYGMHGQ